MTMSVRHLPHVLAAAALAALAACGGSGSAHHARYGNGAPASMTLVRGSVTSVSPGDLVVQTATGSVAVKLTQPFRVYERVPARLADVKDNEFIGVTTVKRADGAEQATEIHIFPEALRGLGEGSRMMTQTASGGRRMTNGAVAGSRMTNGAVSGSRMTNGAVSGSRMSNGSVASSNGSSLVVQYRGGSLTVVVPPNTEVTRIRPSTRSLAAGDQVVVPASKAADGSLTTDKALLSGK